MVAFANVIHGALAVAVQVQSVREALTRTLPGPPLAPTLALGGVNVNVHDWPGGFTVKGAVPRVVPPATTLTIAVPALAIRPAGTVAVSSVALTTVVFNAVPFHCTTAPATNPVPFTVRGNPAPPALAVDGLSDVMDGPDGGITEGVRLKVKVQCTTIVDPSGMESKLIVRLSGWGVAGNAKLGQFVTSSANG
jgi:hypothetical protein